MLSAVGLCAREYIKREVDGTLSGGEMKRLEIATVLARHHKLCIFDEPEAGIDLWSFSMLIQQFEKIHQKKEESLILISHQERIIQMADRIMVIEGARSQRSGQETRSCPLSWIRVRAAYVWTGNRRRRQMEQTIDQAKLDRITEQI